MGRPRKNPSSGGAQPSSPSGETTEVLDVKPLRCLAPMFPSPLGFTTASPPGAPQPFISITPLSGPSFSSVSHANTSSPFQNQSQGLPEVTTIEKKEKAKRKRESKPRDKIDPLIIPSLPEDDPREAVEVALMIFDALRRRILQVDEPKNNVLKRSDLTAGAIMMDCGLRVNRDKRIGSVPGVHVGDIFYFRMETCLMGLHAPSMGGIDYMNTKYGDDEEPLAVSIVSSGGYDDETDNADVLIYSGQGGCKTSDGKRQMDDQKLERGNLALERSLHRANEIRVIRSAKDPFTPNGKIYIYDGLYKIHATWVEKGKAGFNIFKYKLQREMGQPDAFAIWKMTEKWKENLSNRGRVILPDMSSGEETLPVCLVNEVDTGKGPGLFSYATKVKYLIPVNSVKALHACTCKNVCSPGDASCSCAQQNGGDLPYSSNGLLISRKPLIYECSASCQCSANCRNRVTQKGAKFHFEVFRTRERGWGLRSWDPIRAGAFICEYTGEVMDKDMASDDGEENEYIFEASHSYEKSFKWNYRPELLGEGSANDSGEASKPLPIAISAKIMGNVSRFMNHSCSPNVFWQPVQHDHSDECYPHIMFFAIKHIPPMTELTYDYGLSGRKLKKCLCGSTNCRGFFG